MKLPLKIAFYPGTFDPLHKGHIQTAMLARKQYGFDKIFFVPYSNIPGKSNADSMSIKDRVEAIKHAVKTIHTWAF